MQELLSDKHIRMSLLAVFVLLAIFLAAEAIGSLKGIRYIGAGTPATNTIHVQGMGEAFAVPDIAQFSFAAVEEAPTVAVAQERAAATVNEAIEFLEENGIEERDIQTTGFNVYPRYEYRELQSVSFPGQGSRELVGFEVRQSITVKARDTKKAGELLSGLGEIGVQEISGLSFTVDDDESIMADAREEAISDAKEKARELAKQLGVKLVRIVSFNESSTPGPIPYYSLDAAAEGRGGASKAAQIPTGENKFVSNVSITYEIR